MDKRGFTLIELLAVITLLALLAIILIPPMVTQVQKGRKNLSESQTKLIYSATESYIQKYKNEYPTREGKKYCVSLKMLVEEGMLQDTLINQLNDADIGLDMTVEITVDSKVSYTFEFDPEKRICEVP